MRKTYATIVLALLLVAATAWAATTDFVADGDITVANVSGVGSLLIKSGSQAASVSFSDENAFTVTDPDATAGFKIRSDDSNVKAFQILNGTTGAGISCSLNGDPGTSEVSLSITAGTYKIAASTATQCTQLCVAVTNAATYNSYPTCGAASCNSGYTINGTGSSATCRAPGGGVTGGGGGGGYSSLGLTTTPSPSPSATPSVSPSPTPTPMVSGIKDGDLVKTADSPKVYIVNGIYKRWIMNPKIFNLYGHFKWNAIKIISASDLAKYTDSWLVRASNSPKVYELNGDLSKHWLDMTAQKFNESGRKWDMVFIINSAEVKLYKTGVNVMK